MLCDFNMKPMHALNCDTGSCSSSGCCYSRAAPCRGGINNCESSWCDMNRSQATVVVSAPKAQLMLCDFKMKPMHALNCDTGSCSSSGCCYSRATPCRGGINNCESSWCDMNRSQASAVVSAPEAQLMLCDFNIKPPHDFNFATGSCSSSGCCYSRATPCRGGINNCESSWCDMNRSQAPVVVSAPKAQLMLCDFNMKPMHALNL